MASVDSKEWLTSEGYVMENANRMYELMQQGMQCDVDIILKNESFPVHKIIMMASSEYFRSQSWRKPNNSDANQKVTLNNISSTALQWVIHFCYTGSLELTKSTVDDVVSAASYLQVDKLIDVSLDYYLKYISLNNCLRIANVARLHHRSNVWDAAFDFTCKNFMEVMKTDTFLSSDYDLVSELMKSDKINVYSEEDVYRSLKLWIDHNSTDRMRYLPPLLEYIKLELLNLQFLTTEVLTACSTQSNNCQDKILNIIRWHSSPQNKLTLEKPKPRPSTLRVLAVGGRGNSYSSTIEIYNPMDNSWRNLFNINNGESRVEFGAVLVENELYIIGGYTDTNANTMFSINLKNNSIKNLPPLLTGRSEARSVELNGFIYTVGGFNGYQLDIVEKFDLNTKIWSPAASLITTRAGFGLAVLGNKMYAAGGHWNDNTQDTVESYSPKTNTWIPCKAMNKTRNYVELVAFGQHLYAFGGCIGKMSTSQMIHDDFERYDPASDTWTIVSMLPSRRMCIGAVAYNNEIILVGGYNGHSVLANVDHYDPSTNTWKNYWHSDIKRQNGRILTVAWSNLM